VRSRWLSFDAIGAITSVAFLLRWHGIRFASLWYDEAVSYRMATMPWREFFTSGLRSECNMVLYYFVLRFWVHLGNTEARLRMLSVLLGITTVPALYGLGTYLFNRRTGLIAAILLAVHGFHIRYSQEARSYAMLALMLTLGAWFFARMVREQKQRADWLSWVAVSGLAVYVHFLAALMIAGQAAAGLWLRRDACWRLLLQAAAVIGLAVSPLAAYAIWRGTGPLIWVPRLSWKEFYTASAQLLGGGSVLLFATNCAAMLAGVVVTIRSGSARERWSIVLRICCRRRFAEARVADPYAQNNSFIPN
jgi:4-amino-4-deoxy-L-arabinose transferase-like glycosyltransferase